MAADNSIASDATARPSTRWVLPLLFIMMTFCYIDRAVLGILVQPIKEEMHLSDLQIGLAGGLGFAILFMISGIPIARLAERYSRVAIVGISLAAWSAMTVICGFSHSFIQLFLSRVGVGIGESGSGPPVQSLIADYYPPNQRASALSVYQLGIPIGGILGTVIGGAVGAAYGWRMAFYVVGAPGILLAIIFQLTLREPPRGHYDSPAVARKSGAAPSLFAVLRALGGSQTYLHMAAGMSVANFAAQAYALFLSAYFVRRFSVGLAQVGFFNGLIGGGAACLGILAGGFLSDHLAKRDLRWYGWLPAIGVALSFPFYVLLLEQTSWTATLLLLPLPGALVNLNISPTAAAVQNVVEPRMRATAFAVLFMFTSFIGVAMGPLIAGWLGDIFAHLSFARAGGGALDHLCPGGVPLAAASAAVKQSCRSASATGLRWSMIAISISLPWAALHFWLAAEHLRKEHLARE